MKLRYTYLMMAVGIIAVSYATSYATDRMPIAEASVSCYVSQITNYDSGKIQGRIQRCADIQQGSWRTVDLPAEIRAGGTVTCTKVDRLFPYTSVAFKSGIEYNDCH